MKLKNIGYAVVVGATALMFVLGSAATGEAKGKKKAAAPAPQPATCWFTAKAPVCAAKGKLKFTYINSCYASKDGAKVASKSACKAPKAAKGKKGGKKKAKKAKGKKKM
jgi:hypothetical protein